jgi:hypothetical protein
MKVALAERSNKINYRLLSYIIAAGFIAGSLDALAAIFILSHGNASAIFRFISSGIYGKTAFTSSGMVQLGIVLHYFIAYCFTAFYFLVCKYVVFLNKNILVSAVVYGLFIYTIMNIVVFSFSNVTISPRTVTGVTKNLVILMICIALPIVYLFKAYRSK